jgi:hypothetical protein
MIRRARFGTEVPNLARLCGDENAPATLRAMVGDWVGFKSDVEQTGEIIGIRDDSSGAVVLDLRNRAGFSGDYIGGERWTWQLASDCWVGDQN